MPPPWIRHNNANASCTYKHVRFVTVPLRDHKCESKLRSAMTSAGARECTLYMCSAWGVLSLRKTLRRNIFRGKTSQYEVWCFHDISAHFFTLHTKRVSQKLDLKTTNRRTWKSLRDYAMILMLLCDFHLNFCFPTAHWHEGMTCQGSDLVERMECFDIIWIVLTLKELYYSS